MGCQSSRISEATILKPATLQHSVSEIVVAPNPSKEQLTAVPNTTAPNNNPGINLSVETSKQPVSDTAVARLKHLKRKRALKPKIPDSGKPKKQRTESPKHKAKSPKIQRKLPSAANGQPNCVPNTANDEPEVLPISNFEREYLQSKEGGLFQQRSLSLKKQRTKLRGESPEGAKQTADILKVIEACSSKRSVMLRIDSYRSSRNSQVFVQKEKSNSICLAQAEQSNTYNERVEVHSKRSSTKRCTQLFSKQPPVPILASAPVALHGRKINRLLSMGEQELANFSPRDNSPTKLSTFCKQAVLGGHILPEKAVSMRWPAAPKQGSERFSVDTPPNFAATPMAGKQGKPVKSEHTVLFSFGKHSSHSSLLKSDNLQKARCDSVSFQPCDGPSWFRRSNSATKRQGQRAATSVQPVAIRVQPTDAVINIIEQNRSSDQEDSASGKQQQPSKDMMSIGSPASRPKKRNNIDLLNIVPDTETPAARSLEKQPLSPGELPCSRPSSFEIASKREIKQINVLKGKSSVFNYTIKAREIEAPLLKLQQLPLATRVQSFRRNLLGKSLKKEANKSDIPARQVSDTPQILSNFPEEPLLRKIYSRGDSKKLHEGAALESTEKPSFR